MFGLNPYVALGGVLALALAAGGGFLKGESYADGQHAKAENKVLTQAIADRDDKEKLIATLEATAATREQARQATVREIYHDVPTIIRDNAAVYGNTCVDPSGVRLLDRAVAAANGLDPGPTAGGSAQVSAAPANH